MQRLGPRDLARMHALLDVFGKAFDEIDTYGAARPSAAYLERLLASETFVALVAVPAGSGAMRGARAGEHEI